MILDLIKNTALLVTLAVGLRFLGYRLEGRQLIYHVSAGVLFGLVGVIGMMTPLHFAPGVIYDGRSIVLSLAGLFGGPLVAAVAAPICGLYRWYLGGAGALAGIGVIIEASLLGVILHYLRRRNERWVSLPALLLFGIVVHAGMLALQLLIPQVGWQVVREVGLIIMIVFPVGFLLIAQIFLEVERRRRTEQRLKESEQFYRNLFENNYVSMLIIDPDRAAIVDANQAAAGFYGWSRETLQTMSMTEIIQLSPEQIKRDLAAAREARRNHFSVRHRLAGGAICDVEVYSTPIRIGGRDLLYALIYDISDRKRAEEDLRRSEAYQRALIDASPLAIIGMSTDGTVLSWNHAAERIFGWSAEEAVGRPLPATSLSAESEFLRLRDRVCAGESLTQMEVVRHRKDGSAVDISLSVAPVREADGRILTLVGVIEDISRRKQAEREHESMERQLLQARKMEAIGQLAGGVAHDFNNLLQVMIGHGEIMGERLSASSPLRSDLTAIMGSAERAATLVRQLLAFSRRQVLDMKDVDLNEVLDDCLSMLRRLIGEHISLALVKGRALATVRADVGQLGQIIVNLCINARDAMPHGGTITIETENVRIDESYRDDHPWAHPGRYVLLSVSDTGCGIEEEIRGRIFEPFFTTKPLGQGTGLGLATVYGIIKQHDGMVHVYSETGTGTTFKIYLPIVERSAIAVGTKIEGAVVGGQETILVAEDEAMVLNLNLAILTGAGYRVLTAADGEEAVAVFRHHAGTIDLVILDVVMPKLGGFQAFEQIKGIRSEVPVIFTSGYSINAIHSDFVLHEGIELIQKPCGRNDLLRRIRLVLDR